MSGIFRKFYNLKPLFKLVMYLQINWNKIDHYISRDKIMINDYFLNILVLLSLLLVNIQVTFMCRYIE